MTGALLLIFGVGAHLRRRAGARGKRIGEKRLNVVLILSDDERFDGTKSDAERP